MGILRDLASGAMQQQQQQQQQRQQQQPFNSMQQLNYNNNSGYGGRASRCDRRRARYNSYAPQQLQPQMYPQPQGYATQSQSMYPVSPMMPSPPQTSRVSDGFNTDRYGSVINRSSYQSVNPFDQGVPPPLPYRTPRATPSKKESDPPPDYCQESQESLISDPLQDDSGESGSRFLRPVVLPQIDFGDGVPFVRGYSAELGVLGISERAFIQFIDSLNRAEVPNAEMAIANKAMGLASWFVPGAGGILLSVAQIGSKVGGAIQMQSSTAALLSRSNAQLFNPAGLEVIMCSTPNLDMMLGLPQQQSSYIQSSLYGQQGSSFYGINPSSNPGDWQSRLGVYGEAVAQLDVTYPAELSYGGRSDPAAQLAQGMSNRALARADRNATKDMQKGKNGGIDKRNVRAKWLAVRRIQ